GIFAALALLAVLAMRREWEGAVGVAMPPTPFRAILADRPARRLLMLALVNAAPVAVTSTLFLYYVESRLAAPGREGPLLLLFFLAAAVSVPLWGRGAARFGVRPMLAGGMILAILSFGWAAMLGAGDLGAFAVICALSGAALGADMTLMPAIFARRLEVIAPGAGAAFGLWSFVSKFTLAFAAVALLPLLESQGFRPGLENPQSALDMLALLYALLPCALKVMAVAVLMATPIEDEATA
ncbi:MAG: sugar:cation symporter, partial [Alphaproteobacteria bacterium]|nr:sugar:cation symporter [Alphaproteobacteria bacterium]